MSKILNCRMFCSVHATNTEQEPLHCTCDVLSNDVLFISFEYSVTRIWSTCKISVVYPSGNVK